MPTRVEVRTDVTNLIGTDPNVSTTELNTIIQARYAALHDAWLWSRRLRDFVLTLTAQVVSGTTDLVTVTAASATVTSAGTPFTSAMTGRQIQIGAEPQYFFVSFVSSSSITLQDGEGNSATWPRATASAQTWRIFRTIYTLPSDAESVLSLAGEWDLEEADGGRSTYDELDSERETTNDHPLLWAYGGESSGSVREIEIWPVPTVARLLRGQYSRRAPTLADGTELGMPLPVVTWAVATDVANMLHAKTGDVAWQTLATSWSFRAREEESRFRELELTRLSPPRTLRRRPSRLGGLRGTDFEVDHDLDAMGL